MAVARSELEAESEYEFELAQHATRSEALRRVGLSAARSALRGLSDAHELEAEWEVESELNPIRRVYPDALMEHLGHAAAAAESEAEAEAFIGALIPLAARLVPRVAPTIMRAAPNLIRGISSATRVLRANPTTRPLVRALPTVMRRTAADIARQAARGQTVTPRAAVRTLARQTARVLTSPRQSAGAIRRSSILDRQYHRAPAAAARAAAVVPCRAR
jgi:hypothetical protein